MSPLNDRPLIATLAVTAAALFLAPGMALAEGSAPSTPSPTPASANEPGFALKIMPHEAWLKRGESTTVSVVAQARQETTLALAVRAPEGIGATLSSSELELMPGSSGKVALRVVAPENAVRSPYMVTVIATDETGSVREARMAIHLRDLGANAAPAAPAAETKKAEPRGSDAPVDALRAILERIERTEARLAKLEQARDAPASAPAPIAPSASTPARMTLFPEHVTVGPEGGKVALLLDGAAGGKVHLSTTTDAASGWSVRLERDGVALGPHGRAWVWVHLTPGENATAELAYAIVQRAPAAHGGPVVANGTATVARA